MKSRQLEQINIEDLIPYINNSRTHDDKQIGQIAASIKEFGFTNPILIDDNNGIIAGHGRLMAAQKLDMVKVPCIRLTGLTDAQRRAYVIADNKLALNAGWDFEILQLEIETLKDDNFDITLLGFDIKELTDIFDPVMENEPDKDNADKPLSVVIDCDDKNEQEKIFNELESKGYKCRMNG